MEHPEYTPTVCPTEDTQLWCTRLYLERVKKALREMGAEYKPTLQEKRATDFDENIESIQKVTLNICTYLERWRIYTAHIGDEIKFDVENLMNFSPENSAIADDEALTKEEFLEGLRELYIGEWRKNYSIERFGYTVCDGTHWELTIEYNNGHKTFTCIGDNDYPYNFEQLTELFGTDEI